VLPTFFIIGAGKCGTTALHTYLDQHPEIEMTAHKEVHFFLGPDWRRRITAYAREFRGDTPQRGDASPGYTVFPRHADTPERIREEVPEARLIYLVRDPVDRAIAQYAQHVINHVEDRPPAEALDPGDADNDYLCISSYAAQLDNYLRVFPRERLLVIDQRELLEERRVTLRRTFAFLGVDAGFWTDAFDAVHNVRGADNVRVWGPAHRLQLALAGSSVGRLVPRGLRQTARRMLRRTGETVAPEITPELRERMAARLAPEADRLRALAGLTFSHWSV
jgi:hypothetical protein